MKFIKNNLGAMLLVGYISYCGITIVEHPIKFMVIAIIYSIGCALRKGEK